MAGVDEVDDAPSLGVNNTAVDQALTRQDRSTGAESLENRRRT